MAGSVVAMAPELKAVAVVVLEEAVGVDVVAEEGAVAVQVAMVVVRPDPGRADPKGSRPYESIKRATANAVARYFLGSQLNGPTKGTAD